MEKNKASEDIPGQLAGLRICLVGKPDPTIQRILKLEQAKIVKKVGETTDVVLLCEKERKKSAAQKKAEAMQKKGHHITVEDGTCGAPYHQHEFCQNRLQDETILQRLLNAGEMERFSYLATIWRRVPVDITDFRFTESTAARQNIDGVRFVDCDFSGIRFEEGVGLDHVVRGNFDKASSHQAFRIQIADDCDFSRFAFSDSGSVSLGEALNCNFRGSDLSDVSIRLARACDFDGAALAQDQTISSVEDCDLTKTTGDTIRLGKAIRVLADGRKVSVKHAEQSSFKNAQVDGQYASTYSDCDFSEATVLCKRDQRIEGSCLEGASLVAEEITKPIEPITIHACKGKGLQFPEAGLLQVIFEDVDLRKVSFAKRLLNVVSFKNCNLAGADFRETRLIDVDFTGAKLTGARFEGAVFLGPTEVPKLKGAKGLAKATAVFSPELNTFKQHIAAGAFYEGWICAYDANGEVASLSARLSKQMCSVNGKTGDSTIASHWGGRHRGPFLEILLMMRDFRPWSHIDLSEKFEVNFSKSPVKGNALKLNFVRMWSEVLGLEPPDEAAFKAGAKVQRKAASSKKSAEKASELKRRKELLALLDGTPKGVKAWNARFKQGKGMVMLKKVSLPGAMLKGIHLHGLLDSDLSGADLRKAVLHSFYDGTTMRDANLQGAVLQHPDLDDVDLHGADFTGAVFKKCGFYKVNFEGAILKDATFEECTFSGSTFWPKGYRIPEEGLTFVDDNNLPDPRTLTLKEDADDPDDPVDPVDKETFMEHLRASVDPSRLSKALKMLKKDSFQLFLEADKNGISGVVKSQTDAKLLYSCRIQPDGSYCCCTQKLRACGGLRGALCKHLLVLILGSANDDKVDTTALHLWAKRSGVKKPNLDKEAMAAQLLKYEGAKAGKIDWLPTETSPEDYESF